MSASGDKLAVVEKLVEEAAKAGLFEKAKGKLTGKTAKWVAIVTALMGALAPFYMAWAASSAEVARLDGRIDGVIVEMRKTPESTAKAVIKELQEMGLLKKPKGQK